MATPYLQVIEPSVGSTQDIARARLDTLPVAVIASEQTAGRGRAGSRWDNADRALAVSLAFRVDPHDLRPWSLMAGVAAVRALDEVSLKWPNDVMIDDQKAGGILVESSDGAVVVGLGINLWWPDRLADVAALYPSDPGSERYKQVGALFVAEMMRLIDGDGWPRQEYVENCQTLGRPIVWQPDGAGNAHGIDTDGALIVEVDGVAQRIVSGEVRHVRVAEPGC